MTHIPYARNLNFGHHSQYSNCIASCQSDSQPNIDSPHVLTLKKTYIGLSTFKTHVLKQLNAFHKFIYKVLMSCSRCDSCLRRRASFYILLGERLSSADAALSGCRHPPRASCPSHGLTPPPQPSVVDSLVDPPFPRKPQPFPWNYHPPPPPCTQISIRPSHRITSCPLPPPPPTPLFPPQHIQNCQRGAVRVA
jgi:hypothetical protein